jgi:hypothetical protein
MGSDIVTCVLKPSETGRSSALSNKPTQKRNSTVEGGSIPREPSRTMTLQVAPTSSHPETFSPSMLTIVGDCTGATPHARLRHLEGKALSNAPREGSLRPSLEKVAVELST